MKFLTLCATENKHGTQGAVLITPNALFVAVLELAFNHIGLAPNGLMVCRAIGGCEIIGKCTLANGLFFCALAQAIDQEPANRREQQQQTGCIADKTWQHQQTATQRQHQAFKHLLGRQFAAIKAFARPQRRGQACNANHQNTQHGAGNDQQQRGEKPYGGADLEKTYSSSTGNNRKSNRKARIK